MNLGRSVFAQLISFLPDREFRRCVSRYDGDRRWRGFSCWDQFLGMAFAQLTYRESLRDIEACLRSLGAKLYHMGFRSPVARSTLADASRCPARRTRPRKLGCIPGTSAKAASAPPRSRTAAIRGDTSPRFRIQVVRVCQNLWNLACHIFRNPHIGPKKSVCSNL